MEHANILLFFLIINSLSAIESQFFWNLSRENLRIQLNDGNLEKINTINTNDLFSEEKIALYVWNNLEKPFTHVSKEDLKINNIVYNDIDKLIIYGIFKNNNGLAKFDKKSNKLILYQKLTEEIKRIEYREFNAKYSDNTIEEKNGILIYTIKKSNKYYIKVMYIAEIWNSKTNIYDNKIKIDDLFGVLNDQDFSFYFHEDWSFFILSYQQKLKWNYEIYWRNRNSFPFYSPIKKKNMIEGDFESQNSIKCELKNSNQIGCKINNKKKKKKYTNLSWENKYRIF